MMRASKFIRQGDGTAKKFFVNTGNREAVSEVEWKEYSIANSFQSFSELRTLLSRCDF
jgi:hypothetical protein